MTDRPDPIETWREVSATAARATGYRADRADGAARRRSGLASIAAMTVALVIIVVGLALRPATSGIGATGPVTATADDGMFRLELTTPRDTYAPGYAIDTVARVTYLGPEPAIVASHSHSALVFHVEEVDGTRRMEGGTRSSCESTVLNRNEALVVPFAKSGSPTDDPTQGFDQTWYQDPTLTLPVGTWRLTVDMAFGAGGCATNHELHVSNVITVVAPVADGPVVDRADDGTFRFELSTPHRTYRPGDAIEPIATVTFLGPGEETSIHHGGRIVGWVIEEVGGNRTMGGAMTAPCVPGVIRRDTPLTIPFEKSGSIDETFDMAWYGDPVLHLPVGTWRIQAYTTISTDDGPAPTDGSMSCGTRGHSQEVENVITVVGAAEPSVEPSPVATATPVHSVSLATVEPSATSGPVSTSVEDGAFQLTLTTPRGTYAADEAIEPIATVTYLGPDASTTMFHAASPVGFLIEEVGGTRQMDGAMDQPCLQTVATRDTPLAYPFQKAGTTEHGFDAGWYQDPVLHLPVGLWRIRAYLDTDVTDGTMTCGGIHHHLEVENVITVR